MKRSAQPQHRPFTASRTYPCPLDKRILDLACCLVALPFLLLASAVMAIHLALTSTGPVFFRQERVGYRGNRFWLYKFRTMRSGAETKSHSAHFASFVNTSASMQKLDACGDPRLIPGAWILRSSGLDELPQIINVLRGEMSIVGPRPCIPYEYEFYTNQQRRRSDSLPGVTGLWQVSGKNRTTFEEMVALDIDYTARRSLSLDVKIITMTLPAILIQVKDMYDSRRGLSGRMSVKPLRDHSAAASL